MLAKNRNYYNSETQRSAAVVSYNNQAAPLIFIPELKFNKYKSTPLASGSRQLGGFFKTLKPDYFGTVAFSNL